MLCEEGVPVTDVTEMRRDISPLSDTVALLKMAALFLRLKPDVVHTHMSKAGMLGRTAARWTGVPVVVHSARGWAFTDDLPRVKRSLYACIERVSARRTDRIVAVSRSLIDEGLEYGVGTREQYQVIRSGIDTGRFAQSRDLPVHGLRQRMGIPESAPIVGSVMGLTSKKAPFEFLEVCGIVLGKRADVHVVVVGDGELRREFEAAIGRMGLLGRIHLTGLVEDVRPFLAMFDTFLLTSRWEGLPRVVLEALSAGVPVVSSDAGGVSELLPKARGLFIERAGSLVTLSRRVLECLELGDSGDSTLTGLPEEFDIDFVIREHLALYAELAGRKGLQCIIPGA
jgi:glycosyltransferase involved in cell wall biosynthesis